MTAPALVRLPDACKELGIKKTTSYVLVRTGELVPGVPVFRIASRWYVTRTQLDRFIETGVPIRAAS